MRLAKGWYSGWLLFVMLPLLNCQAFGRDVHCSAVAESVQSGNQERASRALSTAMAVGIFVGCCVFLLLQVGLSGMSR